MVWLKALVSFTLLFAADQKTDDIFDVKQIRIASKKIKVAIADTTVKRTQGLMFVENWDKYEGMLFVFPAAQKRSFWMKNTLLPLSLGFFDERKRLFQVERLNPAKSLAQKNVERAASSKPARYVLEMPQGWYEKNQIPIGATLDGLGATSL